MRVAILGQYPLHLLPEAGGFPEPPGHWATWFPQLKGAFEAFADLDVHWVTLSPAAETARTVVSGRQTFHLLPTARSRRASTLFREDRRRIGGVLAELRPDLVHGWGTEDVYALAAATSGFPNVVSMQGILSHYVLHSRMHPRDYLQATIEMGVLWKADRITTESAWGRDVLLRRSPRARIDLVEYGVRDLFLSVPWEPDPACPAALFIGSLTPRKGIQDAVEAFGDPALRDRELWVAGAGGSAWAEALRARSTPNVRWLGQQTPEQTAGLLARAWCLVLPTRGDTSPNVVKEARVIGLPVVTTPCGGQTTYVRNGGAGYLVAAGDVPMLTGRICALLGDLDRTRETGAVDHLLHRRWLDPARTAKRFAAVYRGESLGDAIP